MNITEKKISSKEIYKGKVLHVVEDKIMLPNGKESVREIVHHKGAVCVIPVTDDGDVICVKQFRYAHGEVVLEVPAGKLEETDKDPLEAAMRELSEETGATAKHIDYLGKLYTSPAILDEVIYMYMATGLTFGETHPDEDEFLEVVKIPLTRLRDMVMKSEIPDAKTQACVLRAYLKIKGI